MPRAKVTLNHSGVRTMFRDPGVTKDLEARMGQVESVARSAAPVASGAYRDSIHAVTEQHGDRPVVRVYADVDYAMTVEANTGTLSRALDAAGGS